MVVTNPSAPQPSSSPPPVVSALVGAILRSPLHGLMSNTTMFLSFTGGKSGKKYTIPLLYQQEGNRVMCFTSSPWWKNLRGGAPVTVVVKGRERQGIATLVQDEKELIVRELYTFLQKNPSSAKYRSIRLDAQKQPEYDDVVRAASHDILIQIQLTEE